MAYIRIAAFDVVRVAFIPYITVMPPDEIHPKVTLSSIRVVYGRWRRGIHHLLYGGGRYRAVHIESNDLPRFSAQNSHYVDIDASIIPFSSANEPIQFV